MSGAESNPKGHPAGGSEAPQGDHSPVLKLCLYRTKRELQVHVSDHIQLSLRGRKRLLTVETHPDVAAPDFHKSRDGFVLYWPGS